MQHEPAERRDNTDPASRFSPGELIRFERDGFLVVRGLATKPFVQHLLEITHAGLVSHMPPVEYEADLQYPGAPASREQVGGQTIRRLKHAQGRTPALTEWLASSPVLGRLQQLLGPRVIMPLAHHNCIMTKQPRYSSETGWHQDIRYWSFARPDLISVWLALGEEYPENGGLFVIPGTHRGELEAERLDGQLFLRTDLPQNKPLIDNRQPVRLSAGDVLFFHARTFHAAGRNQTGESKYSAVFTFRAEDNPPRAGSRSAVMPELLLTPGRE
jgi:phytanoyl-CoA hydroxylase